MGVPRQSAGPGQLTEGMFELLGCEKTFYLTGSCFINKSALRSSRHLGTVKLLHTLQRNPSQEVSGDKVWYG